MNHPGRLFSFILFWAMFGILIAAAVLLYRGDIDIVLNGGTAVERVVTAQQNSFADAVAIASQAVITIRAINVVEAEVPDGIKLLERFLGKKSPHRPRTRTEQISGSGVIMDADGYILTNHHVIAGADKLGVFLNDGRFSIAEVVGTDPETDLAVIRIELDQLPVIKPAEIDKIRIGDVVLAIGYPYDVGQTVTQGIISATGRNRISGTPYQNYIQTDAAINPGNSGGALINTRGELIGINSLIYTKTGSSHGIGFAIPIDMASHVLTQLKQNGFVMRGWLGAEGTEVNRALLDKIGLNGVSGVLITAVETDGPADAGGIRNGDIITHINDEDIHSISDIMQTVADGAPGDILKIQGLRMRESFTTEVTLAQRPPQSH